jgi:hypothetical protein
MPPSVNQASELGTHSPPHHDLVVTTAPDECVTERSISGEISRRTGQAIEKLPETGCPTQLRVSFEDLPGLEPTP